ncbi:MAG: hypothetical protein ACOX79_02390 [Methanosarcina sp.]
MTTPIGFGDKAFKSKRYAVFDQTFFEKVCGQAFSHKICVFDQTFFEKVCEQAFFEKGCDQTQPLRRLITPSPGVFGFDQTFLKSLWLIIQYSGEKRRLMRIRTFE